MLSCIVRVISARDLKSLYHARESGNLFLIKHLVGVRGFTPHIHVLRPWGHRLAMFKIVPDNFVNLLLWLEPDINSNP